MSHHDGADHWTDLASRLGATPTSEPDATSETAASSPPPAPQTPPAASPTAKHRPPPPAPPPRPLGEWDLIAEELGITPSPDHPAEERDSLESISRRVELFDAATQESHESAAQPDRSGIVGVEPAAGWGKGLEAETPDEPAIAEAWQAPDEAAEAAPLDEPGNVEFAEAEPVEFAAPSLAGRQPEEPGGAEAPVASQPGGEPDEERRPKRRRRRRKKKTGKQPAAVGDAGREEPANERDAAPGASASPRGRRAAQQRRDVEPESDDAAEESRDADEDLDDESVADGERSSKAAHRAVPTWSEAVGLMIDRNLESRAKRPDKGNGRGGGGWRRKNTGRRG